VENVLATSIQLLGMIDELLEMSRIEAGQIEVKVDEVAIEAIVESSLRVIEPVAKAKGLSVHSEVEHGLQAVTDSRLLTRILMNLAGNAAQYTNAGSVQVRARRRGESLEITVTDTGVGIASDRLGVIFEKFQQIEQLAWTMRPAMGLGLGLAISREFANLLGGAITVESTPGKGSTFTLSIPILLREAHE
jgi:signal transduction histidine kinase